MQFLKEVRDFINDTIVKPAINFRMVYGMPAGTQVLRKGETSTGTATGESLPHLPWCISLTTCAAAQIAVVNNKTKVTESQIRTFLQLCWTKYVRAKIEPGTSLFLLRFRVHH